MKDFEPQYSLRQVVELVGLTEFTLRGWESRYGAFNPKRTDTGRRRYSHEDVKKALALKVLTDRGAKISEIAGWNLQKLYAMVTTPAVENRPSTPLSHLIEQHDWEGLEAQLKPRDKNAHQHIHEQILPLLKWLNVGVDEGKISIAQEHIVSAMVKEQLSFLRAPKFPMKSSARLLFAAPEGELHELGLQIAFTLMKLAGIRGLYLGPNSPAKEVCETFARFGATHIVLAGAREAEKSLKFLNFIDRNLPQNIPLLMGGRLGQTYKGKMSRPLEKFSSFDQLEAYFEPLV